MTSPAGDMAVEIDRSIPETLLDQRSRMSDGKSLCLSCRPYQAAIIDCEQLARDGKLRFCDFPASSR